MKGVLDWIKKNPLIVISVVLILVFLPVGWVFSSGWNTRVKARATEAYTREKAALGQAGSVSYALPGVLEGEEPVAESRAPNRAVTDFYREQKELRIEQVAQVVERGTAFNRRDHKELVPGLLPAPQSDFARRQLGIGMAEIIAGTTDSAGNTLKPSIYQTLLRRLNAGTPPDPAELGDTLTEFKAREVDQYTSASNDGRLTEAQTAEVAGALVNRRLSEYAGRAGSLAFYASPASVRLPPETGWSTILQEVPPSNLITENEAFVWLWDYWIISDVLDAVALANTDPQSGVMSIPEAPVKRIDTIRVSEFVLPAPEAQGEEDPYGGSYRETDPDATVPGAVTHTGRGAGGPDAPFDIRTVQLTAVVSSAKLPTLIDALGRVNNMTVVDVDLQPVDVWAELEQGYFYGPDHVVRATLTIETAWLRSWTGELMPDRVRAALGMPARPVAEPETGDDGSSDEDGSDEVP